MNEPGVCSIGGMTLAGEKPKVVREVPVPLLFCPPQISNKINWDLTRTSAFKGWRLNM